MLIIAITSAFALALVYSLTRSRFIDSSQLSEPRPAAVVLGVQIICGNCAGEADLPVKTYLDRLGNCTQCGGRSYILAANRRIHVEAVMAMRMLYGNR